MNDLERLMNDIRKVIDRHRKTSLLHYAQVVGALEFIKHELITEDFDGEGPDGD